MEPIPTPPPQVPIPAPPPQPIPRPPKNNPWTIIGIIIVLLAGIFIGLMINNKSLISGSIIPGLAPTPTPTSIPTPSPTPDPTANWKTFTNSDEGFSIKYPNTWNDPTKMLQSTRAYYSFDPNNLNVTVGFYYDQNLQRQRTFEEEIAAEEKRAVGKKNIVIGNTDKTIYVDSIGQSTTEETAIYKGKGQNIIWISMPFPPGTDPSFFDQILSTFKYTDQTTPMPTCRPRPTCLDATPRCMIPETSDMCPKASPAPPTTYICPPSGYVDCMPILDAAKQKACSAEAMTWYKANCPNFKGGAL